MLTKEMFAKLYRYFYKGIWNFKSIDFDTFGDRLVDFIDSFEVIKSVDTKIDEIPMLYDSPELPKVRLEKIYDKISLYNMFRSRYPYVDDSIAKYNLLDLEIKKLRSNNSFFNELLCMFPLAHYDMEKNNIYLSDMEDLDVFFHELMHAFSTYFKNGIYYSGFSQFNSDTNEDNFIAFNEAYTLVLEKRRIDGKISADDTEYSFIKTALIIEAIIGVKKMAKSYFSVDMKSIVDSVGTLIDKDEFLRFMRIFDCIYLLHSSNIFNEKLCDNYIHVLSEEIQDYERYIIEAYEDTNHKKLILNM